MADKDSNLIIGIDGDTKDFKKALQSLESVAKTALKGLTAGFATVSAGIAGAVMVGANFEQQMKNVQAISGATGAEFEALTAKAREMGEKTAFSATEAGQAFEYMAMAGWDTQAMLDGISGIMDLAAASGEDLGTVSDIVTDALTAFGLQAKDAGHFADVLAMASSKSNTNVRMLGYSFKYVAPIAGAFKFSVEDVAVALGLMANAGIKSEQAGTSLRALFNRLVDPPKEAAGAIERLNLAVTNTDGTMRPLNDIIIDLRKSFANLTDAEKASVAGSLAGTEAMSGLLAIVNATDTDFQKLTASINNANGSAQQMAETMLNSLEGKFQIFKSVLQETALTIYESFQEPLKKGVEEATKTLNDLNKTIKDELQEELNNVGKSLGDIFSKIAESFTSTIPFLIKALSVVLENIDLIGQSFITFAGGVVAFKGASIILGLAKALEIAKIAMINLNIAFAKNPIGFVITAISTLAGSLYALWETSESFRLGFMEIWYKIKHYVISNVKTIADGIDLLISGINKITGKDIPLIKMGEPEDPNKAFNEYRKKLKEEKDKTLGEYKKMAVEFEEAQNEAQKKLNEAKNGEGTVTGTPGTAGNYKGSQDGLVFPTSGNATKNLTAEDEIDYEAIEEFYLKNGVEAGKAFQNGVKQGSSEGSQENLNPVADRIGKDLASGIRQAIQGEYESTEDAIRSIGANLINSLADEMLNNAFGYLSDSLSQIGNFVITSMKTFFGIASPSKVFKSIGYDNMRGLALGFSENQDIVDNATSGVADKVKAGLENIDANIMPAFNLQALKEMFNINTVTQPQLAGAVAGGGVIININSTFNMTGSGGTGQSQGITAEDLNAFAKDMENRIKSVVNKDLMNKMRAGGILSR